MSHYHDPESTAGWGAQIRRVDSPVQFQTCISADVSRVVRRVATLNGLSIAATTERLLRRALGLPVSTSIDDAIATWRAHE